MCTNTVIVTGGSRGIGFETVKLFLKNSYSVVYTYLHSNKHYEELKDIAYKNNVVCDCYKLDISNSNEVGIFKDWFIQKKYDLAGLVNNAGITSNSLLINMSDETWHDVINVNMNGTFYMCREFAKLMLVKRKGFIVNISSTHGIHGTIGGANYAASKGGIIAFSKSLGLELAKFGIRVNVLAPGYIETDMIADFGEKQHDSLRKKISLNRFGTPNEVAQMVMFLAKGDHFCQNSVITMDGGLI
ncbi:MAG: SDR family oxidoreductase [Clostridia bacterium]|nr:SDR family oxidoreductase [Clostridia bacterium]